MAYEISLLEWRKKKWPDKKCMECKHYMVILQCQHCIRYQGRRDKWVAISGEIAHSKEAQT